MTATQKLGSRPPGKVITIFTLRAREHAAFQRKLLLFQNVSIRHETCFVIIRVFGGFSMRSLATAFSLALAVLGVTIASMGSALAIPVVAAPEPMTGLVFGAGLVGAALIRRRNKK